MIERLHTQRLELRPLQLADAAQVQRIFPQWDIVRHLAAVVPWPYPEDGAWQYFSKVALPAMKDAEEWHWTLRLRCDPDHIIGAIGLKRGPDNNRGYWLGLPWQRQGLMSEAADTVTDYWFDVLRQSRLRVPKATTNEASRRISMRQGMRMVETRDYDFVCGRFPAEIWEISAAEWAAHQRSRTVSSHGSPNGAP